MSTTAKNILSLAAPVLLLVFGFLALRAGILSNEGGPAITGVLCLSVGIATGYWWMENMLLPPMIRWFKYRRAQKALLNTHCQNNEHYPKWEDIWDAPDYDEKADVRYEQFLKESAEADETFLEETCWMTIWWDEEYRRTNVEF